MTEKTKKIAWTKLIKVVIAIVGSVGGVSYYLYNETNNIKNCNNINYGTNGGLMIACVDKIYESHPTKLDDNLKNNLIKKLNKTQEIVISHSLNNLGARQLAILIRDYLISKNYPVSELHSIVLLREGSSCNNILICILNSNRIHIN